MTFVAGVLKDWLNVADEIDRSGVIYRRKLGLERNPRGERRRESRDREHRKAPIEHARVSRLCARENTIRSTALRSPPSDLRPPTSDLRPPSSDLRLNRPIPRHLHHVGPRDAIVPGLAIRIPQNPQKPEAEHDERENAGEA